MVYHIPKFKQVLEYIIIGVEYKKNKTSIEP